MRRAYQTYAMRQITRQRNERRARAVANVEHIAFVAMHAIPAGLLVFIGAYYLGPYLLAAKLAFAQ